MRRGTTPTIIGNVSPAEYLMNSATVYMTVRQGDYEVTKTGADLTVAEEAGQVAMTLTQEETLKLWNGKVEIQVGGVYANGYAWRTQIVEKDVRGALYEEVMR